MRRQILYSPEPPPAGGGAGMGTGHPNGVVAGTDTGAGARDPVPHRDAVSAALRAAAQGEGSPAPVPYERFQQVIAERNKHKADLDALAAERAAWREQQQQLTAERDQARGAELRTRVAATSGLPLEFADRLQGATEEELRADAARLQQYLKPASGPGVPPPPAGGQPARIDLSSLTPAQILEKKAEVLRQARGGYSTEDG